MKNLNEYVYYVEVWVDGEPYKSRVFRNEDKAYVWGTENAETFVQIRITGYKVM